MNRVVIPPGSEPVTLQEARYQCRVDSTDEDSLIIGYIQSSRERAEKFLNLYLLTQTIEKVLDDFADEILLKGPVQSITKIEYVDPTTLDYVELDSGVYRLDSVSKPARITLEPNREWSDIAEVSNAVKITYVAGYASVEEVPQTIKDAIKLLVSELYDQRSKPDFKTFKNMLAPYRVRTYA